MMPLPPCDHDGCPKTACAKPGSVQPDGSAAIQAQLLDLIGKAARATKSATNEQELQTCGQLTRRLCHALTGL